MSINVNDKNLGHATAYAYYKAGGGTMTESEFTEFMADFGTASQTAVEAAQAALASKNAAQTAATTATNKATEATTAATTATNKAAEAQADADAAALDASQALSAASTATTKATEATTAAATATSAATTATTAKDDAVSAKTAAQTAQTGAETAAASVSASAAQIATNADDIAQLKSEFTAVDAELADVRVGGDGVTYNSAGAAVRGQISDLKSAIKKSNIGEKYYSVKDNTYLSSTNGSETYYGGWEATDFIPIDSGDSHILYYSPDGNGGRYNAFYNGSKVFISSFFSNKGLNNIAIPSGAVYFRLSASNAIIDGTKVYTGIQREIDSLSTVVRQIGESDKVENCLITRAGVEASTDLWDSTDYIHVFSNGVISFQCFIYGNGSLCFFDEDKNILLGIDGNNASSYGLNPNTYVQQANITPPQGTRYVRMCVWKNYASITDLSLSYECKWNDNAERVLDGISKTDEIAKGYSEKKILVLGDSISADAYGNYKKWVTNLIDEGKFKQTNVTNSSQHATGFVARYNSQTPDDFITRMEAIADKSTYDLVVVFGGINDFIQNVPLGGESGETDKTVYFKPAVDYFFQYLVNNFTQARICVLLPLRNYSVYPNTAGNKQEVYSQYIHDVAKSYCLPVLNLTEESGFCPFIDSFKQMWTLIPSGYTNPDGTHPNAEYEKKYLAPMIWKFISGLIE